MNFLLITIGSHGDIHPFLALGRALQARGHRAAVLTNPYFEAQIRQEGLEPLSLGERVDLRETLTDSRAMNPHTGPIVVMRNFVLPMVPTMIEATGRAIKEFRPDVAVIHPICLGPSWVCRQRGVPVAIAALAPCSWFNPNDSLVLPSFRGENPSPRAVRFDLALGRLVMGLLMDRPLNKIRRSMGLPPMKHIIFEESVCGDINLGLWSPHFRRALPGDPRGATICGFPWHDRHRESEHDQDELDAFLRDSEPPIVFSLGTAAVHTAGRFYHDAAAACRLLKRRGLLLVGLREYEPPDLPQGVRAFTYAPFSQVFKHGAAIVHHGGIGTTGQGLRSGRPTVVCPLSHDQYDNAARVARLGVSRTLKHGAVTMERLAGVLREVLDDPGYATRAGAIGAKVKAEDGAVVAATSLESMLK